MAKPRASARKRQGRLADGGQDATEEMMELMLKDLGTTRQVADLMGVDQAHVQLLIKRKRIAARKVGGVYIVHLPSVAKYLKNKSTKGRPPSHPPKI